MIVLHPFPVDLKMRFGMKKPLKQVLGIYTGHCRDVKEGEEGWFLMWRVEAVKRYILERLLLH